MHLRKYSFAAYLFVAVAAILLILEFTSLQINRAAGVELPFFLGRFPSVQPLRSNQRYSALDPHLGYARGNGEPAVERFRSRYPWYRGFAIYSHRPLDQLDHPLILTLGGSTTDALTRATSWPEELAKLLVARGLAGTVINGGVGGYSTNQELLKLIRDGIEFGPDLVISYSGVNDRGAYGILPHPMVHPYQRKLMSSLTRRGMAPIVPNTISLLRSLVNPGDDTRLTYTLGVETKRSLGECYARNLTLMHAVAQASGAGFLAVVQPSAYVGDYDWEADFEKDGKPARYVEQLRSLYAEIGDLPAKVDYVYSFIGIFDGVEGVYQKDGVHTTQKGDQIIARKMLELITDRGAWRSSGGRAAPPSLGSGS